jgi:hypothetical protein
MKITYLRMGMLKMNTRCTGTCKARKIKGFRPYKYLYAYEYKLTGKGVFGTLACRPAARQQPRIKQLGNGL